MLPYGKIPTGERSDVFVSFKRYNNNTVVYTLKEVTKFYLYSQWLTKFVPSIYIVVFTVALPLNLMAIVIFLSKIKIKTPAVVYMLNLAIADVLFVAVLPFNIVYRFSGNNWKIGEGMCRFATAAFYCNMYCSILLMTSMSADRYMAVVFPIHSLTWRTKKRSWLVCVFIWLVSIASTVPLLITNQTLYVDGLDITTCHDALDLKEQQSFYMYYFTAFSSIFFFFPLIITIFCYAEVIRALSENPKNIKNSSSKKKRAILLSIIVLSVFMICFGPTNIIFLMHYLHFHSGHSDSLYFAYILCVCISSISTCLDPLMYYYVSSRCRKYVYSLLCCKMSDKLKTENYMHMTVESYDQLLQRISTRIERQDTRFRRATFSCRVANADNKVSCYERKSVIAALPVSDGNFDDLHSIYIFQQKVLEGVKALVYPTANKYLDIGEEKALKWLQTRDDMVIKPADKGGNVA
ncbi:proteinase-activated receptor 1-like [Bufo gargarizans]|uniref:proteinase-activated receptor 1-like n=1 Tax=Bufo gargarizans TaxID=30331 RepID=UPI001CF258C4|nr:proteinase-activated receptor 1-like [Bufo gargarizans]